MTPNFRDVVQTRRLAESLGCIFNWNTQITPSDDGVIPLTLRLPKEDLAQAETLRMSEAQLMGIDDLKTSNYENEGWFCGAGRFSGRHSVRRGPPCLLMRIDCGNIRDKPFSEIGRRAPTASSARHDDRASVRM